MKTVFKVGQKVFDIRYGWGVVNETYNYSIMYPISVKFLRDNVTYTLDGRSYHAHLPLLSLTEYTIQGFSQERPVVLPEAGELVLVRNHEIERWRAFEFHSFDGLLYNCYQDGLIGFKECKRFKFIDE